MRVSQLARKLEISPSDLILFYKKNKIGKYNSANNKIEEEDLALALGHFKPEEMVKENGEKLPDTAIPLEISRDLNSEDKMEMSESSSTGKPGKNLKPELSKDQEDEIEVIRMPKIKLEGVKVVGKIDLPDPVKKVKDENKAKQNSQEKDAEEISSNKFKREYKNADKGSSRQRLNRQNFRKVLSYEEKLKREERRKVQEQQRAKRLKKDLKKQHYLQNVQSTIAQSAKNKRNKKSDLQELEPIKNLPEYKNPIRKFWAWLNGEYDR